MADTLFDLAPAETKEPSAAPSGGGMFDLAPITTEKPAPARKGKLLENTADESDLSSTAKNIGTGVATGFASLAGGMGGDVVEAARRLSAGLTSLGDDRTTKQILDQWDAERAARNQARIEQLKAAPKPSWARMSDEDWERAKQRKIEELQIHSGAPPTTQDVYQHSVAPKVGTYTPTSTWGEYGQAAIAGAIPGIAAGPLGAVSGVTGGISSVMANKAEANPFWSTAIPLAVGAGTPTVAKGVSGMRRGLVGPNAAEQQARADTLLKAQTKDIPAARQALNERAGMPDETLAQATLDKGHAKAQDTLLTAGQPEIVEAVRKGQEGRVGAMRETLQGIERDAAPEDVSKAFQQHHEALLKNLEDNPEPKAPSADESGAAMQETLLAKNKAAKDALNTLKATIDPERKMGMWARDDVTDYAKGKLEEAEARPDLKRSAVVDDYLKRASQWGDVKNFSDSMDFVRSLNDDIRSLQKSDPTAARDLFLLKKQVQKAQNNALEHQHKWQQEAVMRGELAAENTIADQLNRNVATTREARARQAGQLSSDAGAAADAGNSVQRQQAIAGADGRAGTGEGAPGGPQDVPGVGGAKLGEAGGPPDAAGNTGVPLEPLSSEAAERLRLFNQGHGLRKDTFEAGPAADVAKAKLSADAAAKAFVKGPKGYEVGQAVLNAGGGEALASMKNIAVARLQAELKGKPLDQKALTSFKTEHFDALRAIDEREPGFSNSFNDAATARTAVQNFENGAAADYLGAQPGDIVNHVGKLLKAPDSEPIRQLMEQAPEEAKPGIRRAAAQSLETEFEGKGPGPIMNALTTRRANLDAMFEPEAVSAMEELADNFKRSATVQSLGRQTTGSPTAERATGIQNLEAQIKASLGKDIHSGAMETGVAIATYELLKEMGIRAVAGDIGGALQVGAGMIGLNMIKPALEKALMRRRVNAQVNITHLLSQGLASREVGQAMLERAIRPDGTLNQYAIDTLADALAGAEASQQQNREGRASGGRVGSAKELAGRMLEAVEKARKLGVEQTKPILKHDDNIVANALAVANRSL